MAPLPADLTSTSRTRQKPHAPPNEALRQATLAVLGLDGAKTLPPDPMLQSMCKTITRLMSIPMASVMIIQDNVQRVRASEGISPDFCCSRDQAFCSWTLLPRRPQILVVENATQDPRFASLDLVTGPFGLRFYAGAPLVASNGTRLGAVCVIDTHPRKLCAEEYNLLSNFSEIATRRLEERDFKRIKTADNEPLQRAEADLAQPMLLCDLTGSRHWDMLFGNEAFTSLTGVAVNGTDAMETGFWRAFKPAGSESKTAVQKSAEDALQAGKEATLTVLRKRGGDARAFSMHFRPARHTNLSAMASSISVPSIVAAAELGEASLGYCFATVGPVEQLTPRRLSKSAAAAAAAAAGAQHTFVNAALAARLGDGANGGMRDVAMGVLCANTPEGLVYRARWRRRSVCVKVQEVRPAERELHEGFGSTPVPLEAALTLNLDHPHVLSTFKVVLEDSPPSGDMPEGAGLVWMVREWCGRGTLSDALLRGWLRAKDGSPDVAGVLRTAAEVASAVAFLHGQGIVHGDVCPDSVQLQERKGAAGPSHGFTTKLTEFGISARVPASGQAPAVRLGNAAHAAPELLAKGAMSQASDVYALGMLLWELYTGQAVWPSLNYSQLHRRVVAAKEQPALPADAPHALKELIKNCLANDAADRPSSQEVVAALEGVPHGLASGAPPAPPTRGFARLFTPDSAQEVPHAKERRSKDRREAQPQVGAAPQTPVVGAAPQTPVKPAYGSAKSLFRRLGLKLGN